VTALTALAAPQPAGDLAAVLEAIQMPPSFGKTGSAPKPLPHLDRNWRMGESSIPKAKPRRLIEGCIKTSGFQISNREKFEMARPAVGGA